MTAPWNGNGGQIPPQGFPQGAPQGFPQQGGFGPQGGFPQQGFPPPQRGKGNKPLLAVLGVTAAVALAAGLWGVPKLKEMGADHEAAVKPALTETMSADIATIKEQSRAFGVGPGGLAKELVFTFDGEENGKTCPDTGYALTLPIGTSCNDKLTVVNMSRVEGLVRGEPASETRNTGLAAVTSLAINAQDLAKYQGLSDGQVAPANWCMAGAFAAIMEGTHTIPPVQVLVDEGEASLKGVAGEAFHAGALAEGFGGHSTDDNDAVNTCLAFGRTHGGSR